MPIRRPVSDRMIQTTNDTCRELARQLRKWGVQDHDDTRWLLILAEELGEVMLQVGDLPEGMDSPGAVAGYLHTAGEIARGLLTDAGVPPGGGAPSNLRTELIQVAAVAIQWAAAISRRSEPALPMANPACAFEGS